MYSRYNFTLTSHPKDFSPKDLLFLIGKRAKRRMMPLAVFSSSSEVKDFFLISS
jgi:hypothetical protein